MLVHLTLKDVSDLALFQVQSLDTFLGWPSYHCNQTRNQKSEIRNTLFDPKHLNTIVQNKSIYLASKRLRLRLGYSRFHRSQLAVATILLFYTYSNVFYILVH